MMEIKFRGKRVDNGEWIFGGLLYSGNDTFIVERIMYRDNHCNVAGSFRVDPKTIGQFTGLKDKYNKEIYKGDIVTRDNTTIFGSAPLSMAVIVYDENNASFWVSNTKHLDTKYFKMFNLSKDWKVVGNIYDDLKLLKARDDLKREVRKMDGTKIPKAEILLNSVKGLEKAVERLENFVDIIKGQEKIRDEIEKVEESTALSFILTNTPKKLTELEKRINTIIDDLEKTLL